MCSLKRRKLSNINLCINPCTDVVVCFGRGENLCCERVLDFFLNGKLKVSTPSPQQERAGVRSFPVGLIFDFPLPKAGFPNLSWIIRARITLYFVTICYRKFALNRVICSYEFRNFVAHSTENPLRFENDALTNVTSSVTLTPQSLNHSHQLKSRVQFIAPIMKGGALC